MSEVSKAVDRSSLMKKVRQRHTAPEMTVRKWLHSRGWRYRLHQKGLPGTPDVVFPARRAAIFINGCFWHGHNCRLGHAPKSRQEFWLRKMEANRERDARKIRDLVAEGWRVMTVWQCSLVQKEPTVAAIEEFLMGNSLVSETQTMGAGSCENT